MRRGRSVDDFELECAALMEIGKAWEESFGALELGGQAFVEGVVKNFLTRRRVGYETLDDRVPFARDVEHHRGEFQMRIESGGRKLACADSGRLTTQARQAKGVAQALWRIDCDHRGVGS